MNVRVNLASSPSGKAEVCKTSIGGSIPPDASNASLNGAFLLTKRMNFVSL